MVSEKRITCRVSSVIDGWFGALTYSALVAHCLLLPAGAMGEERGKMLPLASGPHRLQVEVANTAEERGLGLMGRRELGDDEGMLLVYPKEARICLWMRNTLMSAAFVDQEGRIVNIADMAPRTDTAYCATTPARFALEMNRGWFAARGIAPGERLSGLEALR